MEIKSRNSFWFGWKKLWEKEKILVTSIFSKKGFFSRVAKSRDCVVNS